MSTATSPRSTPPRAAGGRVTPYIAVADARRALNWYAEALGARSSGQPIVMPDGRVGHAEIDVAGGLVMLSDEHPEIDVLAPRPGQGFAVTLHAEVPDVDPIVERAVAAGAILERPAGDTPYGRIAVLRDPFGHRWMLNGPPPTSASDRLREGDVVYVSLWVPDGQRAATFFASVLGWRYGTDAADRQVVGTSPRHGIAGGHLAPTLFACFAVDDLDAALTRVRGVGGRAEPPRAEPYGRVADCVDDQGVPFALYQRSPDDGRPSLNGDREGDLAYVTFEVVDSAKARRFYAEVFGWRFSAGSVPDGWQVEGPAPMAGMHGGHEKATAVPMYRVNDIEAAVARVRDAGGSASEPERQPYGITAECTDDQATRFSLGQL